MIPDFEQLNKRYNVCDQIINNDDLPFEKKINKAVWRGATTGYHPISYFRSQRSILCQISENFPELVDAGFTIYCQGQEHIPELVSYKKNWLSYEELLNYKYLVMPDGNAASYTASCWRFFSNSCVLICASPYVQWYYPLMHPFQHFIPIAADCNDLIQKLILCEKKPDLTKKIVANCKNLADNFLRQEHALAYLYHVLALYSELYQKANQHKVP